VKTKKKSNPILMWISLNWGIYYYFTRIDAAV